ncbi:MAG: hypothetical protein ACFFBD_29210 [Candidatus Hodarchaeota archaeon]
MKQEFKEDTLLTSLLMVEAYKGTLPPDVAEHLNYFLSLSNILLAKQYARYFLYLALKQLKPKINRKSILTLLLLARQAVLVGSNKKQSLPEPAQTRFAFLITQQLVEDLFRSVSIREGLVQVLRNGDEFTYQYPKGRFRMLPIQKSMKDLTLKISEPLTDPEFQTSLTKLLRRF